ncbi:MAG: ABC transporter permease [Patescibacteria group bacterium]
MNAIYILWIRQLKRFIRKKASVIGALGQPVIFLFAFGFGLSPMYSSATGGGDYIQFIAPGIIAMTVLFSSIFTGMEIIWDKQFGFLKETFVAPVSRFQIFMGKTLGGMSVAAIQGLLVFLVTLIAGFRPHSLAMLPVGLLIMLLVSFLFSALGAAIAARLEDMQGFPLIFNFIIQPLFYLSGALFPVDNLPAVLSYITKVNPLTYGVDSMRYAFSGASAFSPVVSISVLLGVSVVTVLIGIYQFNKIEL